MRDLIVQWLTQITAPFWKSSLSIDQFITALQLHPEIKSQQMLQVR